MKKLFRLISGFRVVMLAAAALAVYLPASNLPQEAMAAEQELPQQVAGLLAFAHFIANQSTGSRAAQRAQCAADEGFASYAASHSANAGADLGIGGGCGAAGQRQSQGGRDSQNQST